MAGEVEIGTLLRRAAQLARYSFRWGVIPGLILSRLSSRVIDRLGGYTRPRLTDQRSLIERRDWNVLVILDACRYDAYLMSRERPHWGRLKPVYSPASITPHWLVRTWLGGDWRDTIYISGNIFANKSIGAMKHLHRYFRYRLADKFLDIVEVWRNSDPDTGAVPPERVYRAYRMVRTRMRLRGLRLGRDYRLVIHFMQPHTPYLATPRLNHLINRLDRETRRDGVGLGFEYVYIPMLRRALGAKADKALWRLYMDNLERAARYARLIAEENRGYTVITADHGEMLGEYNLYFHFDVATPELRVVPYHRL